MNRLIVNIVAVGYYDDFARFFFSLKEELKSRNVNVKFYYLSLFMSGWLFFLFRLKQSIFFSMKTKINSIKNRRKYLKLLKSDDSYYAGISLNDVIRYHYLLDNSKKKELKIQAMSYIDVVKKFLIAKKPSVLFLSGDSRLCVQVFDVIGDKMNIPRLYFEQGPFRTTIIDDKGVNANSSFRNRINDVNDLSLQFKQKKVIDFLSRKKGLIYKRNPLYRGCDFLIQNLFSKTNLLPIDIVVKKSKKQIEKSKYSNLSQIVDDNKEIYLLILQVPFDANMVYHSPHYPNHYEIVKDVFCNLPNNSQLIVREHPLYKQYYEKELYDFMIDKKISIDVKDLNYSIDKADVVVVNNSTVGIEAIAKLKSVVVLGNSYYDSDKVCFKLKIKEDLRLLLSNAKSKKINANEAFDFLYDFTNNYLIEGHFRDNDLGETSKKITNKIFAIINEK